MTKEDIKQGKPRRYGLYQLPLKVEFDKAKKQNYKAKTKKITNSDNLEPYDKEFSFWDDADNRVDSLETDLPHHILYIIRNEIKNNNHSNKSCLTEEERLIEELYWKNRNNLKLVSYDMPEVTQPDQPEVLSYYISCDDESPINVSSGGYINALGIWEP